MKGDQSFQMKHEGKYSCVAENTAGSSRTEATLKVEESEFSTFMDTTKLKRLSNSQELSQRIPFGVFNSVIVTALLIKHR